MGGVTVTVCDNDSDSDSLSQPGYQATATLDEDAGFGMHNLTVSRVKTSPPGVDSLWGHVIIHANSMHSGVSRNPPGSACPSCLSLCHACVSVLPIPGEMGMGRPQLLVHVMTG